MKKSEVVIIKGDKKDRNEWKLGIVEEVMPGKDDVVRAVRLRAGGGGGGGETKSLKDQRSTFIRWS